MISDLKVYGQGSATEIQLYIYLQFKGPQESTADLTFTLNSVGGPTYTETVQLDNPCNSGIINNDCAWALNEVFFDVPEDGFTIEKGQQLRLQIDGSEVITQILARGADVHTALGLDLDGNDLAQVATTTYSNGMTELSIFKSLEDQSTGRISTTSDTVYELYPDAEEGTIRKKFATSLGENAVHGSDSDENAVIEINYFFKNE
mgnify:CR=1 FL=1